MIGKIKEFSAEVMKEMKKVSWPTKEQLKESTVVVIVTTVLLTLYTFGIDEVISIAYNKFFS